MYGQNHEDDVIVAYLKTLPDEFPRRFMDVGAFAPKVFSNTRLLVEDGWSGVYVEPAPSNFSSFLTEYLDNDKMVLVNAAIAGESALIPFWDSGGDAISSSVPSHVAKWSTTKFRKYLTKTITWDELFNAVGVDTDPITVLSIDVEAMNLELFSQLLHPGDLFKRLLPSLRVFVIEHDSYHESMTADLIPYGFTAHQFNGENVIFVR